MKAIRVLVFAFISTVATMAASASTAKNYAEADERIEAASARCTGMRTKELAAALSRDWPGKNKEDLVRWFEALPKRLDATWVSKRESSEAVVIRISTEYPADREYSAVFRFWLSAPGVVNRVQFYHEGAAKETPSDR